MTNKQTLEYFIKYAIHHKASDIHLSSSNYPLVRVDGSLSIIQGTKKLDAYELQEILKSNMTNIQKSVYSKTMELDFTFKNLDGNRFRVNAFKTVNGPSVTLRGIPSKPFTLDDILAPTILKELCTLKQGLILVVGATGSGKSTTLSAMINHINHCFKHHIITIEDPVEFTYESVLSLINQREVGISTSSFPIALRSALREDPDVIVVGEIRDLETTRLTLTAAETGHLVIGTLHTKSAAHSINRIIDIFSSVDKSLARSILASSLKAVISQRLVPKINGGRIAIYEIMIVNNSIKNLIKDDKIPQINSMIEIGKNQGMVTFKESIIKLYNNKLIKKEVATELLESIK